jgi:hypothetical protein
MTKPKQEPEKNILKRPAEAKAGLPAGIVLDRIRILHLKIWTGSRSYIRKQCLLSRSACFWASRIHYLEVWIRILPFSHRDVERTEIMLAKYNHNKKIKFLRLKTMCLRVSFKKKYEENKFCILLEERSRIGFAQKCHGSTTL